MTDMMLYRQTTDQPTFHQLPFSGCERSSGAPVKYGAELHILSLTLDKKHIGVSIVMELPQNRWFIHFYRCLFHGKSIW